MVSASAAPTAPATAATRKQRWKAFWYLDRISPAASMAVWRRLHENVRDELEANGAPSGPRAYDRGEQRTNGGGQVQVN